MPSTYWKPPPFEATNVGRFATEHGIADFDTLLQRSIDEPEWFWAAVVQHLGIDFDPPYAQVLDTTDGIAFAKWFVGGGLNLASAAVDRHAHSSSTRTAILWEGEDGTVRSWTYAQLRAAADAVAVMLQDRGVVAGDAVGIFMPMLPETVAALLGVMKVGAVFLPLFSGYGEAAIATRLHDAEAKVLMTATGFFRRGARVDMESVAFGAVDQSPSVTSVVVFDRMGDGIRHHADARAVAWPEPATTPFPTVVVDSEETLFVAYTSGTTGKPKGSVAVHGGFGVKVAEEVAFQFDCRPDDTLFWLTDMGWIMGPWEVTGTLVNGATLALYEGAPDYPDPGRLWAFVARHRVSILGISPTLVRSLMPYGDDAVVAHDRSSLRILGSTGEPWNETPWRWYFDVVGDQRCPIINISGGTEVGACFLSPHPVHTLKPMSLGGPALGMAVDVYDENGQSVRGEVGELVCTKPWPGMTRGLYKDNDRYLETYWSTYPGVWRHGDWASVDADGFWFLHGRSDDTIKLAGKRLGPAEVESALVSHPAVVEAAAIGLPDEVKGESLWAFVVLAPDVDASDGLRQELVGLVADRLGKAFRPAGVKFVSALPKTRNAKVLRRAVRAAATGSDPGDLSALEDPTALDAVRAAR